MSSTFLNLTKPIKQQPPPSQITCHIIVFESHADDVPFTRMFNVRAPTLIWNNCFKLDARGKPSNKWPRETTRRTNPRHAHAWRAASALVTRVSVMRPMFREIWTFSMKFLIFMKFPSTNPELWTTATFATMSRFQRKFDHLKTFPAICWSPTVSQQIADAILRISWKS